MEEVGDCHRVVGQGRGADEHLHVVVLVSSVEHVNDATEVAHLYRGVVPEKPRSGDDGAHLLLMAENADTGIDRAQLGLTSEQIV